MKEINRIKEEDLVKVVGGESGNLSMDILSKMDSYERYKYEELYRRLNDALELRDIKASRFYYSEAMSWEMEMKRRYA